MRFDVNIDVRFEAEILSEQIVRVSLYDRRQTKDSALNKYGFIRHDWPNTSAGEMPEGEDGVLKTSKLALTVMAGATPTILLQDNGGKSILRGVLSANEDLSFDGRFDLSADEKLLGFGDQNRERIDHRGEQPSMWVRNAVTYIPIPLLVSTRGYAVFVNTTFKHTWDLGATDPNAWSVHIPERSLDMYVIYGPTLKDILSQYTEITGRPVLSPKWSFGLWFLCRDKSNSFEVMTDALNFRDRKIPCDVIGLEPNWMSKNYDFSVDKAWHPERFDIPEYAPNGPDTFISALKRMGYHFELWLCMDYDLSYEAERRAGAAVDPQAKLGGIENISEGQIRDLHVLNPAILDPYTRPAEPWFEHLKKFIDQGADLFKQDGAHQVNEHPDRLWGNGMTDNEMHNLYPLLYSQQMYEGFREHTGRRPCGFTDAGWAGLQRYTGTWTGDTAGGPKTLVAVLNLAMSGHSLVTCDMDITSVENYHYGFLLPWAQLNSWDYYKQPWYLGEELYPAFCDYARLRSQLIPYLYTYAYVSHMTGIPMVRPMILEYPDDLKSADVVSQYFLGRELLVSAYSREVYLPEGRWLDLWTSKIYEGSQWITHIPPENRGGGLFLRANSIMPWGPVRQYMAQKSAEGFGIEVFVEPGQHAVFELYDDDGITFEYQSGHSMQYTLTAKESNGEIDIAFPQALKVDINKIRIHCQKCPMQVRINGQAQPIQWNADCCTVEVQRS